MCARMFLKMDIGLGRSYLGLKEKFMPGLCQWVLGSSAGEGVPLQARGG